MFIKVRKGKLTTKAPAESKTRTPPPKPGQIRSPATKNELDLFWAKFCLFLIVMEVHNERKLPFPALDLLLNRH